MLPVPRLVAAGVLASPEHLVVVVAVLSVIMDGVTPVSARATATATATIRVSVVPGVPGAAVTATVGPTTAIARSTVLEPAPAPGDWRIDSTATSADAFRTALAARR